METVINYFNQVYDPVQRIILFVLGAVLFVAMIVCAILGVIFSVKKEKKSSICGSENDEILSKPEPIQNNSFQPQKGDGSDGAIIDNPKDIEESRSEIIEENEKKSGKWEISQGEGGFFAKLYSPDGKKLLTTTEYSGLSGIKSAVTTVIKNLGEQNATVTIDEEGLFRIKVFSTSGKLLAYGEKEKIRYYCERDLKTATENKDSEQIITNR